ncbi:unnamed protein product [Leptosia nina]|uniref:Uncharacterized protein n=1 Tax=Leptosia nina TaxID=320188 RepID=A0AAV1JXX1_9NEOP
MRERSEQRAHAIYAFSRAKLTTHAAESWERDIGEATADWTALHRLCRRFTGVARPIHPLRDEAGTLNYAAADRAEILASHLEWQFSPHPTANPARVAETTTPRRLIRRAGPKHDDDQPSEQDITSARERRVSPAIHPLAVPTGPPSGLPEVSPGGRVPRAPRRAACARPTLRCDYTAKKEDDAFSDLSLIGEFLNQEADECGVFATLEENRTTSRRPLRHTHNVQEEARRCPHCDEPHSLLECVKWQVVEEAIPILKPFYEVTNEISTEKQVSLSKVIVYSRLLHQHISNCNLEVYSPEAQKMITSLKAQIHRRFYDKSDVESNVLYAEATILDPRFKNRGFRDLNKYERAVSGLKKKVGLSSRINVRTENIESRSTAQPRPEAVGKPSNSSASIWQKFDEEVSALVPCNPVAAGIVELDKYIQEPLLVELLSTSLASITKRRQSEKGKSKRNIVKRNRICFKCLSGKHRKESCRKPPCRICKKWHHALLHVDVRTEERETATPEINVTAAVNTARKARAFTVEVFGPKGTRQITALLDEGSTPTLLDSTVAKRDEAWKPQKPKRTRNFSVIDHETLVEAEKLLLKRSQWESFADEISSAKKGHSLGRTSKLRRFETKYQDGLLRLQSRVGAISGVKLSQVFREKFEYNIIRNCTFFYYYKIKTT